MIASGHFRLLLLFTKNMNFFQFQFWFLVFENTLCIELEIPFDMIARKLILNKIDKCGGGGGEVSLVSFD